MFNVSEKIEKLKKIKHGDLDGLCDLLYGNAEEPSARYAFKQLPDEVAIVIAAYAEYLGGESYETRAYKNVDPMYAAMLVSLVNEYATMIECEMVTFHPPERHDGLEEIADFGMLRIFKRGDVLHVYEPGLSTRPLIMSADGEQFVVEVIYIKSLKLFVQVSGKRTVDISKVVISAGVDE